MEYHNECALYSIPRLRTRGGSVPLRPKRCRADAVGADYPKIEEVKHKAYSEKINDTVSFEMVPIPGGTYMMGSPEGERAATPTRGRCIR